MSVVRDNEAAQRKGVVGIKYLVGQPISILVDRKSEAVPMNNVRNCCPTRFVAGHLCLDKPVASSILYYYLLLVTPFVRHRLQIHSGMFHRRMLCCSHLILQQDFYLTKSLAYFLKDSLHKNLGATSCRAEH